MATNISDIIKNSENMSATELGGSLLQRQEEQKEDLYNRSKRSNKVNKTLALVLAGQSIFSEAYKAREKQLADAQAFELKGNKTDAMQINNISRLVQTITPNFIKTTQTLSPEERATQLLSDTRIKETFKENLKPQIDSYFKEVYGEKELGNMQGTAAYAKQLNSAINNVAKEMLTKDDNGVIRIENFINELPNLFKERDFDRLELLEKGVNLKPIELTEYEAASYKQMREKYRAQGNIVGGIKAVFRRLSGKAEDEGSINIFKKLEDLDLSNPELGRILNTLDLKGFATSGARIANIDSASNVDYNVQITEARHADLVASVLPTLQNLKGFIEDAKVGADVRGLSIAPDDYFGSSVAKQRASKKVIIEEDYVDFLDFLEDNPAITQTYSEDVGAIVLRIKNDPKYATSLYRQFSDDEKEIARFGREIMKPRFQVEFASLYVARKGFTNKALTDNDRYSFKPKYEYNKSSVAVETGASFISMDKNTKKFVANEAYYNSTKEEQQIVWDSNFKNTIQRAEQDNLSSENTQAILDLFFSSVPSPDGKDQVETMLRLQRPPEDTRTEDTRDTRETSEGGNTYRIPPSTDAVLTVIRELNPDIAFLSDDNINGLPAFSKLKRDAEKIISQREKDVAVIKGAVEIGTAVLGKGKQDLATNKAIEELRRNSPDLYQSYTALLKLGLTREEALQKVEESK
jgi:hypothetical protein